MALRSGALSFPAVLHGSHAGIVSENGTKPDGAPKAAAHGDLVDRKIAFFQEVPSMEKNPENKSLNIYQYLFLAFEDKTPLDLLSRPCSNPQN